MKDTALFGALVVAITLFYLLKPLRWLFSLFPGDYRAQLAQESRDNASPRPRGATDSGPSGSNAG